MGSPAASSRLARTETALGSSERSSSDPDCIGVSCAGYELPHVLATSSASSISESVTPAANLNLIHFCKFSRHARDSCLPAATQKGAVGLSPLDSVWLNSLQNASIKPIIAETVEQ